MEDNIVADKDPQTNNKPEKKERTPRWFFSDFSKAGVRYTLAVSIFILILYMAGSMPDPGFPDRILFFLLRLLRYTSLACCAFSLFSLGYSVHRLVYHPSFRNVMGLFFYFAVCIFTASLAMLDTFIVAATGGNV